MHLLNGSEDGDVIAATVAYKSPNGNGNVDMSDIADVTPVEHGMVYYDDWDPDDDLTYQVAVELTVQYKDAGGALKTVTVPMTPIGPLLKNKDTIVDLQIVVGGRSPAAFTATGKIAYWDGTNGIFGWK